METQNLTLKLKNIAQPDLTIVSISQIPGIIKVEQVFPEDTEPEFSGLYVITADSSLVKQVLLKIRQNPDVENVYIFPGRKPMQGGARCS